MRNLCRLVSALLVLTLVPLAYSQEVRASLTGTITDSTGAAVANAAVQATNLATNTVTSTKSNESGTFVTPFLAPGQYLMTVEASGFKKFVRENIQLQAGERVRLDVKLEVGEVTTSVTVSDSVSQLQTETATRSQTLANEIVASVPTQGRNPFQIAWAASGVIKSGDFRYLRSFDIGGTTGISINGGRSKTNEMLLDGISDVQAGYDVISVPTTESVQEFKVQANTYDAQYGRTGGGVITIVTKGGGNDFHGTAFEYFQNDKLNANQSELNQPLTRGNQYFANGYKAPNHINQFGAMASGPFIIPKVVNTKNRAFWMLSWESMRQRSADPGVTTFPTAEMRTGDFSGLQGVSNNVAFPISIYDPLTTNSNGIRQPFAGNAIPSSRIDPVAKKVMSYYPMPSSSGNAYTHANNYPYPSMWMASFDQFVGRTDFVVNSKNNVFFRYNENPFQEFRGITFGMDNVAEPSGNTPLLRNGRNVMMNWTSTISPTMTFDLRVGLNRWESTGGSSLGAGYDAAQLGISSAITSQITRKQFPRFNFSDQYQAVGAEAAGPDTQDTYSIQPNINKVVGRHVLKFGVDLRQYNKINYSRGYPSGYYNFSRAWTQKDANKSSSDAGDAFASFLLGYPVAGDARIEKNIDTAYRHFYYAGFFQDDWKVNSRLTINVGLRWDVETGNKERFNRSTPGLDFNAASPIASKVSGLNLIGAMQFAGVNGVPETLVDADKNNWQPRVGVAYRLGEHWVLRGGYGLYFLGQNDTGSTSGFSRTTTAIVSNDNNLTPIAGLSLTNAFIGYANSRLLDPIGSSQGASSFLGESVTSYLRNRPLPYSHQYSFDIQRELPGNILFEIGYAGNTSRKLVSQTDGVGSRGWNLNYIPAAQMGQASSYYTTKIANPMFGLIPNNSTLNAATITRSTLLTAFPQYSGAALAGVPIGRSQYHGMSVKVTKRLSHGLSFLANYGIGKNLEQTRPLNDQDFTGITNFDATPLVKESTQEIDAPQKFAFAGIYELPFGKGRAYANSLPAVVEHILGGWQVNVNYVIQSGWVVDYPNNLQVTPGSAKLDNPTRTQWFNTSLWNDASGKRIGKQASYTLRNYPFYFSDVRRPGMNNWDTSLMKYFPIHEQMKLQFRFEMVNMMNHPWFAKMASTDLTSTVFGQLDPTQRNLPRFIKLAMHLNW